ncbi:MAG: sulfatase, partial [Planctomyces sp.]
MHPQVDGELLTLRRRFLGQAVPGLGTAALAGLLQGGVLPGSAGLADVVRSGSGTAHPVPRAK